MRVPVYEELKISQFDVMAVLDQMKKSRLGHVPCYIDLVGHPENETDQALQALEDALIMLKVSPLFPYPFFIISDKIKRQTTHIPIVQNKSELPAHFKKPVKRLTSKELSLLNKAVTLTERISNTPLQQRQKELDEGTRFHKMLFQLSKELDFYQEILEDLQMEKKLK